MLRDSLAAHVLPFTKLGQGLPIPFVQPVQQSPPPSVSQRTENCIGLHET
jgi:hypothetical protein